MNVLHYSLSLSACPKCHLFICKHTSLADLGLDATQEEIPSITESKNIQVPIENRHENSIQQRSSNGTNFYMFPSTTNVDNRYSWTTFGTDSFENTNILDNISSNTDTLCENVPFANENIINSLLPLTSTLNPTNQVHPEKADTTFQSSIRSTKNLPLPTLSNKSLLFPSIEPNKYTVKKLYTYSNRSFFVIMILLLSFLITNTIDIVLVYIYYHVNYLYFISFMTTIILCDIILWINNLIQFNTMQSCCLLTPFMIRPYLLYKLVELLTIIFDRKSDTQLLCSSSSSSTSTTGTTMLDKKASNRASSSMINSLSFCKLYKRRLFHHLLLFYLVHTGFLTFVNTFFWLNNFQQSTKSLFNRNFLMAQWMPKENYLLSTSVINSIPNHSSISPWSISNNEDKPFTDRTILSHWLQFIFPSSTSISVHFTSSSKFVLISLLYYLIINYSLVSTFLSFHRFSYDIILSILSRLLLIVTRIYALILLCHFDNLWISIGFLLVHLTLIIPQLFHRSKFKRHTMFLQVIFSLITHHSIDDIAINTLISMENLSVFLYRLYLETFSFNHDGTTLRLVIFISALMSLQIIGYTLDILSKNILYRTKSIQTT